MYFISESLSYRAFNDIQELFTVLESSTVEFATQQVGLETVSANFNDKDQMLAVGKKVHAKYFIGTLMHKALIKAASMPIIGQWAQDTLRGIAVRVLEDTNQSPCITKHDGMHGFRGFTVTCLRT